MNSALIVSRHPKAAGTIKEWLGDGVSATFAESEAEAAALLSSRRFDLLVVNAPLADGTGEALCHRMGVYPLLLVPQAMYDALTARVTPRGVLLLPKPVSPTLFRQAVSLLLATRAKVERLEGKLEEVRIVDRAKWALIQTLKMSEGQAHRYIEKQAMDLRKTKREVAENIVKTYEN